MFPHVLALLLLLVLVLAIAEEQLLAQQAKISGLVQATDYGVKCDGTTDDRLNIAAAVAALPPTNGILQFPAGTCIADSSLPLISLTDRNSVTIKCVGARATTLKQNGTGDAISLRGTVEIHNITIQDCALNGNGSAGYGIVATNLKDSVINRVLISG